MRVTFCGVRGSTCAPGMDFVRYGGHTSCVALSHDGEPPTLVLDAGTGLRNLTSHLGGQPFRGTILLGHLHWDHTHGIPFFAAGNLPGSDVTVVMPAQGDPEQVLERAFSPPHFPVTPTQLQGSWKVTSHDPGRSEVEGFSVLAAEMPHKSGRTFGYRVTDGGGTLAYLSDHSPIAAGAGPDGLGAYHESALALAGNADVLVHDAPAHCGRVRGARLPRPLGRRVRRRAGRSRRRPDGGALPPRPRPHRRRDRRPGRGPRRRHRGSDRRRRGAHDRPLSLSGSSGWWEGPGPRRRGERTTAPAPAQGWWLAFERWGCHPQSGRAAPLSPAPRWGQISTWPIARSRCSSPMTTSSCGRGSGP